MLHFISGKFHYDEKSFRVLSTRIKRNVDGAPDCMAHYQFSIDEVQWEGLDCNDFVDDLKAPEQSWTETFDGIRPEPELLENLKHRHLKKSTLVISALEHCRSQRVVTDEPKSYEAQKMWSTTKCGRQRVRRTTTGQADCILGEWPRDKQRTVVKETVTNGSTKRSCSRVAQWSFKREPLERERSQGRDRGEDRQATMGNNRQKIFGQRTGTFP